MTLKTPKTSTNRDNLSKIQEIIDAGNPKNVKRLVEALVPGSNERAFAEQVLREKATEKVNTL